MFCSRELDKNQGATFQHQFDVYSHGQVASPPLHFNSKTAKRCFDDGGFISVGDWWYSISPNHIHISLKRSLLWWQFLIHTAGEHQTFAHVHNGIEAWFGGFFFLMSAPNSSTNICDQLHLMKL